jgi:hypothetical protein
MTELDIPGLNIPPELLKEKGSTKFSPKLDFDERCAILAMVSYGVKREVVARAYSIDKRTVAHIVNSSSPHYKDVRRKYTEMGRDSFIKEYATPEAVAKLHAVRDRFAKAEPVVGSTPASARAKSHAGTHVLYPPQCAYPHTVEIAWRDADGDNPAGWWYRDATSSEPELWLNNGPESLRTSSAALKIAETNLVDD